MSQFLFNWERGNWESERLRTIAKANREGGHQILKSMLWVWNVIPIESKSCNPELTITPNVSSLRSFMWPSEDLLSSSRTLEMKSQAHYPLPSCLTYLFTFMENINPLLLILLPRIMLTSKRKCSQWPSVLHHILEIFFLRESLQTYQCIQENTQISV